MEFDTIFFFLYGLFSLIMGILNKRIGLWGTTRYDGSRKLLGDNYYRVNNIAMGVVSIFIGIALYHKKH